MKAERSISEFVASCRVPAQAARCRPTLSIRSLSGLRLTSEQCEVVTLRFVPDLRIDAVSALTLAFGRAVSVKTLRALLQAPGKLRVRRRLAELPLMREALRRRAQLTPRCGLPGGPAGKGGRAVQHGAVRKVPGWR